MPLNSGAWATTHFNPNLEVRILGSSVAQEEQFRNQVTTLHSSLIGCWLYEIRGAPDMNRTYTICRQDAGLYITTTWTDGTSGTEPIEEKPHPEGRFLQTKSKQLSGSTFCWTEKAICSCGIKRGGSPRRNSCGGREQFAVGRKSGVAS